MYPNGRAILARISDPIGGTGVRKGWGRMRTKFEEHKTIGTYLDAGPWVLDKKLSDEINPKICKTHPKCGILLHGCQ
jgi:hypothetical protein